MILYLYQAVYRESVRAPEMTMISRSWSSTRPLWSAPVACAGRHASEVTGRGQWSDKRSRTLSVSLPPPLSHRASFPIPLGNCFCVPCRPLKDTIDRKSSPACPVICFVWNDSGFSSGKSSSFKEVLNNLTHFSRIACCIFA